MSNTDIEAEFDPFEHDPLTKKSNGKKNGANGGSGRGVAWLALLLALVAVAYNGYQWWLAQSAGTEEQGQQLAIDRLQQSEAGINDSIRALQDRLAAAEQQDDSGRLAELRSDIDAHQSRISELGLASADNQALIEAMQALVAGMERRTTEVESGFAALAARSGSPGERMDLAEIDYLLRLAGERLALFGDARSADHALEMADTQLAALDDPLYLSVRRRIAEARQAVVEFPQPDLVDISGRIAALQSGIPSLPFPGEVTVAEVAAETEPGTGIWQRIKNALKPLVKVRRRVNQDQELSLEDKDYLRQGLWLQLESARLSLMRNDTVAWDLSLQRARDSLQDRFAAGAATVAAALDEVGNLQAVEVAREAPDISAPWRQLRLLREGREQSDAAAEASQESAAESAEPEDTTADDTADQAGEEEGSGG